MNTKADSAMTLLSYRPTTVRSSANRANSFTEYTTILPLQLRSAENTHAEECRCFNIADIPLVPLCLSLRSSLQPGNDSGSNLLDECFLLQPGKSRTLFAKQAKKQVCNRIPHGLDAFL